MSRLSHRGLALRVPHLAKSADTPYFERVLNVAPLSLIGLWRLAESSGSDAADSGANGYDGTYVGATLAGLTGPDGENAPVFDGVNDYVELYSAGLAGAIDTTKGSALVWVKAADSSVWTDGQYRRVFHISSGSALNQIDFEKYNVNNSFRVYFDGNASGTVVDYVEYTTSRTDWFCAACTWDLTADEFKVYIDGVQVGTTQTGLGAWGAAISDINIGSRWDGAHNWKGGIALAALWDETLSDSQIAALGSVT